MTDTYTKPDVLAMLARHKERDREQAHIGYALMAILGFWLGWFAHWLLGAGWFA